jgi:hypothetical protein
VGPNYHIDALHLRRTFGRALWRVPEAWGENGWIMKNKEGTGQVVVAIIPWPLVADDEADWIYASISFAHRTATQDELEILYRAVWKGKGWAYQVFAPTKYHRGDPDNPEASTRTLWGRLDGVPILPDFVRLPGVKSV